LLVALLSAADVGNLWLFLRIQKQVQVGREQSWRGWAYFAFLAVLAYGWWYFDPLAVFAMLLGIDLYLRRREVAAGAALGLGLLVKLFPILALVMLWRQPVKKMLKITLVTLGIGLAAYGGLWLISPEFTSASLFSQLSKGSWETVWALIDGNYRTGNFGPVAWRLEAEMVDAGRGLPARIPPWLTLLIFGGAGLAGMLRSRNETAQQKIAVIGWTWTLFLLWSSGWSPQWLLYLLPLILLVFPKTTALMISLAFVLVNLLEWPVILSRGWFYMLQVTILLRTLLLGVMAYLFYLAICGKVTGQAEEA
jgi:hypothetical protein